MKVYLQKLLGKEALTKEDMQMAAAELFREDISDSEIAAFLIALKAKGETAGEITEIVQVLREHALPFTKQFPGVMDNCGTGGDGSKSFNISSTSAFVIAGAGVKVAKHGNRSVSSRTGSADVLEYLGVRLNLPQNVLEEQLEEVGISFLFAPHVHPSLKRIMKVRKELNIPTIFNLIGPLTNPVHLDYQLLGIYQRESIDLFAEVLSRLNRKRAVIVNGAGFMDEASLQGENHLALIEKGEITRFLLRPDEVELPSYHNSEIQGGDAKDNARILLSVLNGKQGAYRDTVLLNAGLGIYASGLCESIQEGVKLAKESIDSGQALSKLERLIQYSNRSQAIV
ncbi:anthranilate phosphoribosyltransferase [Peribacillus alkalitolerans]|uniref:anthranilate phosphoribosyltransferase n=1 Tax=Peribacillus alkalitolerans TaxID=1550385 RepID=UPI0013D03DC6|nr:anthranilate phosphoribosyltransferase [Peribacillus alkalitolerans]